MRADQWRTIETPHRPSLRNLHDVARRARISVLNHHLQVATARKDRNMAGQLPLALLA
jgi:hypothetical protein